MSRTRIWLVLATVLLAVGAAWGQPAGTSTGAPDVSAALQLMRDQQNSPPQAPPKSPVVLTPETAARGGGGVSELEAIMSARVGQSLRQFGYDQVGVGSVVTVPQTGAVQDDYVLGPGDTLDVSLRGQENSTLQVVVDRNGQVTLPRLNPLPAAGLTLKEFRDELTASVHRAYISTEAYVSVDTLRQVSVLVTGEIAAPGRRILTGLSTPLDAIEISGGIKKSGSLRAIQLIRGGKATTIDLYGLLTKHGHTELTNLMDGDRIFVPPIGVTVGIGGFVRRPGIYELLPGQKAISARESLALADGPAFPAAYRFSLVRTLASGKVQFTDVTAKMDLVMHQGDALLVRPESNGVFGRIDLVGAVRNPGAYAAEKYHSLHDLISSSDTLLPGAYVLFGFIDRIDPTTLARTALPFSPLHVIQGKENETLRSGDTVHILTTEGATQLVESFPVHAPQQSPLRSSQQTGQPSAIGSGAAEAGGVRHGAAGTSSQNTVGTIASGAAPGEVNEGAAATATTPASEQAQREAPVTGAPPVPTGSNPAAAPSASNTAAVAPSGSADLGGFTGAEAAALGKSLVDYQFSAEGAVRHPGNYLVAPNTTLGEALVAAGGLSDDADLSAFELTTTEIDNTLGSSITRRQKYPATAGTFANIVLKPFDVVNFRHVYADNTGGLVTISGEVRYPGTYDILRGEHLSSVLIRAGGLTDVSYPYGTVFLRQSVAAVEAQGMRKSAEDIRSQMVSAMTSSSGLGPATVAALNQLLADMASEPPVGRISLIADPAVLAANPAKDLVLEPGDRIYIPSRPSTVTVLGEVMQTGSYVFNSEASVDDYIARAGGLTRVADSGNIIVVLPDGSAKQTDSSWLSFGGDRNIPPGSVIVVPRYISTFSLHQIVVDTVGIVSQLATTAAALAVLSKQ